MDSVFGIHRIMVVFKLDLVHQAFIEYWWFSGSWIWFFRHSSNIGGFQGLGIWFFRHSSNIGGFQGLGFGFSGIHRILVVFRVLDLVDQMGWFFLDFKG